MLQLGVMLVTLIQLPVENGNYDYHSVPYVLCRLHSKDVIEMYLCMCSSIKHYDSVKVLSIFQRQNQHVSATKPNTNMGFWVLFHICAVTCDFQQCGMLTNVDSDKPMQPPLKLKNSK